MADQSDPMVFTLTDEQREFRAAVRAFLEHYSPESEVRRAMVSTAGYDPVVWRAMAEQLNLQGLAIPEEYGGEGFGYTELALVLEEMGAALLPGPYFASSVLAASVLVLCADEDAKTRHLPGIAGGDTIGTVALTERSGRWDLDSVETRAERIDGGWALYGTKYFVPEGVLADLVLVVARTGAGVGVFRVDDVSTLDRRRQSTLDPTRRQAVIDMVGVPATRVDADGVTLATALAHASAALASEQVGGAQRCLDLAVGYAKVRNQFGRPIGSFQAIRHTCADLMLAIECARGAAQYAAHAADALPDALPAASALAKAHCTEAYQQAAAANIQLHGGIGFTWEHPAHLYYRRAKSGQILFGTPAEHRAALADLLEV